jgi:hypothetical protein
MSTAKKSSGPFTTHKGPIPTNRPLTTKAAIFTSIRSQVSTKKRQVRSEGIKSPMPSPMPLLDNRTTTKSLIISTSRPQKQSSDATTKLSVASTSRPVAVSTKKL